MSACCSNQVRPLLGVGGNVVQLRTAAVEIAIELPLVLADGQPRRTIGRIAGHTPIPTPQRAAKCDSCRFTSGSIPEIVLGYAPNRTSSAILMKWLTTFRSAHLILGPTLRFIGLKCEAAEWTCFDTALGETTMVAAELADCQEPHGCPSAYERPPDEPNHATHARNLCHPSAARAAGRAVRAGAPRPGNKPNIILILADDLGYGDVGCYNSESKVPTPNLDQLAREGMRFTDAHAPSTVCTPSRYSLLTGQMDFRIKYRGVFAGVGGPCLIKENQLTLPQMLRNQGYATAMTGKWHIGLSFLDKDGKRITQNGVEGVKRIDYSRAIPDAPIHRGFDRFFGTACCPGTDWLYAFIEATAFPCRRPGCSIRPISRNIPIRFDNREGHDRAGLRPGRIGPGLPKEEPGVSRRTRAEESGAAFLPSPLHGGGAFAFLCGAGVERQHKSWPARRFHFRVRLCCRRTAEDLGETRRGGQHRRDGLQR